jgi:hypothetical protein
MIGLHNFNFRRIKVVLKKLAKNIYLVAALSIAFVFSSALAQNNKNKSSRATAQASMAQIFQAADKNYDRELTLKEFENFIIDSFAQADKNQDKFIDETESSPNTQSFKDTDTNNDKKISLEEMIKVGHKNFKKADQISDRVLTPDEIGAYNR